MDGSMSAEAGPSSSPSPPRPRRSSFCLPPEILLTCANYLLPLDTPIASPFDALKRGSPSAIEVESQRQAFLAVLRLSSLNISLRRLLSSLIWQDVLIHRPDRLGKLRSLMDYYQRLASSFSEIDRLIYPLPLIRSLRIVLPDHYLSLDQEILRHLLRSGLNPVNGSLRYLEWDAEVMPGPMIWRVLGSKEKLEGLEDLLAQRKKKHSQMMMHRNADGTLPYNPSDHRIQDAAVVASRTLTSSNPPDLQTLSLGTTLGQTLHNDAPTATDPSTSLYPSGLLSLNLNCRIFFPLHFDISRLRHLRHLTLTNYDSHLIPPYLPALLLSLHSPLRSLSMSTSKTSLLQDVDLLSRGCFSNLEDLDIYPIGFELPLVDSLRSAGGTLKNLRLILDVSLGSFKSFDCLFDELSRPGPTTTLDNSTSTSTPIETNVLTSLDGRNGDYHENPIHDDVGSLPNLEILYVDPLPQENTAPRFQAFLASCPRLRLVNGRPHRQTHSHKGNRNGDGNQFPSSPSPLKRDNGDLVSLPSSDQ